MKNSIIIIVTTTSLLAACPRSAPPPSKPEPPTTTTPAPSPPQQPDGLRQQTQPPPPQPVTTWTVHAIDVGTGLSIFVRGPDFSLLYDAGSNDDSKLGDDNRVLAYLTAVEPNLTEIDHVLLSHPHKDHVELLPDVINKYEVGTVYDSGRVHPICGYRRFVDAIANKASAIAYRTAKHAKGPGSVAFKALNNCDGKAKLPPKTYKFEFADQLQIGTEVKLGEHATMKILHAFADDKKPTGGELSPNENSLVVQIKLGPHVILLMGDAEGDHDRKTWPNGPKPKTAEGRLLDCCKADLDADILVVGHHGSRTSTRTGTLDAVTPKISIVSSGPHKYSGTSLPDSDVIDALAVAGKVLKTLSPDADEKSCRTKPDKIGNDNDGKPGGCDNIQLTLTSTGAPGDVTTEIFSGPD